MSQNLQVNDNKGDAGLLPETVEVALLAGDLSRLSTADRLAYYHAVCKSLNLNPLTRPFEYIILNGKLTLYARRECTEQLRRLHNISLTILSREVTMDCYVVTARATMPDGRTDESTGACWIKGSNGDSLCNSIMKAETKAKRRVTLSICGLGITDESEVDTIEGAKYPVGNALADMEAPVLSPKQRYAACKEIMRLWQQESDNCPVDSIPIRISVDDLSDKDLVAFGIAERERINQAIAHSVFNRKEGA